MALEGLKLKPIKRKPKVEEKPKKKFNFKTNKRAVADVQVAPWLEDKTVDEVAELWKIGHSAKRLSKEDQQKFKEIKYCLKYKFGLKGV